MVRHGLEGTEEEAHEHGEGGRLRRHRNECRDRRRRPLVGVGRPHVERHRRHLEEHAEGHQDDSKRQHRVEVRACDGRQRRLDRCQIQGAERSVDQRHPVEQDGRRGRSEHEVLDRALVALVLELEVADQDVDRQRHQFEADVEAGEVGSGSHHEHADGGKEDQGDVLTPAVARTLEITRRHQNGQGPGKQNQQLEKDRQMIDHEHAAENRHRAVNRPGHHPHQHTGDRERTDAPDRKRRTDFRPMVMPASNTTNPATARKISGRKGTNCSRVMVMTYSPCSPAASAAGT